LPHQLTVCVADRIDSRRGFAIFADSRHFGCVPTDAILFALRVCAQCADDQECFGK
jgi:hypothetical protein